MLHTLPESRRRPHRSTRGLAVSVVLHSAVIGAALAATASGTLVPDEEPIDKIDYYVAPPKSETPPAPAAPRPPSSAPRDPSTPALPTAPPLEFPTIVPPDIPLPGAGTVTTADDFANGLRAAAAPPGDAAPGSGLAPSEPWRANMVEREVLPLGGTAPRYPDVLRSAGVEGTVVAEFVVDTTGRVETSSVTIVEGAHPLFEAAVRQALRGMRYRPAEAGGRKVRQLVRQPYTFAITR